MWPFSLAPRVLVRVKFCKLTAVPVKTGKTYTYVWRGRRRPKIGSRAWVRALNDNIVASIVTDFGAAQDLEGHTPKSILRPVTSAEVRKARRKASQRAMKELEDAADWFEMMRVAAGLSPRRKLARTQVPRGYPPIPPVDGVTVNSQRADDYGAIWWRAYRQAHSSEAERFKEIAVRWYIIRCALIEIDELHFKIDEN